MMPMNPRANRFFSNLTWTLGVCAALWIAGAGSSIAGAPVPELDPGSAVGGIALAMILAAAVFPLRFVERYDAVEVVGD